MDVGQILTVTAKKFSGRTAIISGDQRFTYGQFNERVNRFAHGLSNLGFKKGDKVAVLLFNSNPFAEVYFATAKLGGAFTPINYRFAPEEVKHILNHSDSRFFIFGEEFTDLVRSIRPDIEKVKTFISAGDDKVRNVLHYETLLKRSRKGEPGVAISEKDVCQLMYTSGTTGRPKGALITHGNVLWNLINTILGREDKEGEVALIIGPLYHTAALNNHFTIQVALAGTSVLIKKFDPKNVMEIVQKEKVNVISGAPAMYRLLLALPNVNEYDTRSITKCTAGAAIFDDTTKQRLLGLLNAEGVYDVDGQPRPYCYPQGEGFF